MKPSSKSASAVKPASKSSASPPHVSSAPADVPPHTVVEDAPKLRSNRPVKATGSGFGTAFTEIAETSSASTTGRSGEAPAAAPAPPVHLPARKSSVPVKPPSRKAHATLVAETSSNSNNNNNNNNNAGSSCSSMATEKTGQRSAPPSLPLHRATTSRDGAMGCSEESEAGIVESSRSYLTRLSLEDAVVALERLRFLMMSHTAAVTGSQLEHWQAANVAPPQQTHVDPFKLSKRPLEDIAEELCSQLRRLSTAYAVASAADRCLLGVPDERRPTQPFLPTPFSSEKPLNTCEKSTPEEEERNLLGTFGPMVSTQHMLTTIGTTSEAGNFLDTRLSMDTEDSWGAIDLHKPNPGPRSAYPQRDDGESGPDFGSTVYRYPNGMVVSYPMSTFGELVSTESGQGTTVRSRGANTIDVERHVLVSDGTQTDDTLEPTKKEKELQAYVKALEARLSEKQRLEAMRESRGAKKSGISENLSKLARSIDNTEREADRPVVAPQRKEKGGS